MRLASLLILLAFPGSALAAVTVIGTSPARSCYEAARSPAKPLGGIEHCNTALLTQALTREDEVATHVNRGILRATNGDIAGALRDYDIALRLDPNEPEAWLNKAFAALRTGQIAEAVSYFDSAVAKRTREPAMAHFGRGVAHEQAGNARAAYADYVRARDLAPDWPAPQEELRRFRVERRPAAR